MINELDVYDIFSAFFGVSFLLYEYGWLKDVVIVILRQSNGLDQMA